MSLGSFVRRLSGPYEHAIASAYRAIYVDLDALVECFLRWQPVAMKILEVGCGEGAVTERLRASYRDATITAIDVTPRVGRLYRGPRERVRFVQCTVQDIAAAEPGAFDLVILSDVLHHVPVELRQGLLDSVRVTLAPGGLFVFKEWERNRAPIHWISYASDRWLTGDRVQYMGREEMRRRLIASFGADALAAEARIGPWRNNLATLVRMAPAQA
jgi:ubiquinone/menaquinone biosynthesis C-methylase UbiE